METFKRLEINEYILKAIVDEKFVSPTQIQKKSIPSILKGDDVTVTSATGSGKTLCFAVKAIEIAELHKGVQSLIIVPTRELAKQVGADIKRFAKYTNVKTQIIFGGESIEKQTKELNNSQIVVSTTGRLLDLIEKNLIDLKNLKLLVLDEADLMINNEFKEDIEKILEIIPNYAQKLLFSATINEEILKIASKYLNNPKKIKAEFNVDPEKLTQVYYEVDDNLKLSLLVHLLKYQKAGLSLIFVNRHETAEMVSKNISKSTELEVQYIHGAQTQSKRDNSIKKFREQKIDVLVATDIGARGLDIAGITHIYNYNQPKDRKGYIHRIGRTARAGAIGKIINLIAPKDTKTFVNMMGIEIKQLQYKKLPEFEKIEPRFNTEEKAQKKVIKLGNKKFYR